MTQKARSARWHANNKEKHREKVAAWRGANRDHANSYARTFWRENPEKKMLHAARQRAYRKGLAFTITAADIAIPDVCPVLGIRLVQGVGTRLDSSPSLDRRDNRLGYVPGNIVVISHRANRLKADATPAEALAIARYMGQ